MGGDWGTIIIGVVVDSFEEARKLFIKLGKTVTIEQVRDHLSEDSLIIEKYLDLSDHPHNAEYQKKYDRLKYTGDFQPHFDHEHGYGWVENKDAFESMSYVVIGIQIFDSYAGTNKIPLEYINKKLTELKKVLPTANAHLTHEHS